MGLIKVFFILLFCSFSFILNAQDETPNKLEQQSEENKNKDKSKEENSLNLIDGTLSKDSLKVSYYNALNVNDNISFNDTLIGRQFLEFTPHWKGDALYGNLGNLGSATYPITLKSLTNSLGAQVGVSLFDSYNLDQKDLIFMNLKVPFTQGEFHQGNELKQSYFKGFLAVELTPHVRFSFRYNNINHEGFYLSQTNRNKNMVTGIHIHSYKRYKAVVSFATNKIEQQNNGGITTDSLLDVTGFQGEISVPIRLNEKSAYTFYKRNNIYGNQSFDLLKLKRNDIALIHDFDWRVESFKAYDTKPDSAFYSTLAVFDTDLRRFIKVNRIDNNLGLSWDNKKFSVSAQVMHQYAKIENEPKISDIHYVGLKGNIRLNIKNKFELKGQIKQLNSSLGSELFVKGDIDFKLKNHYLNVFWKLKSNIPAQNYQYLKISNNEIYNNDLNNITTNSIGGSYIFKPWQVSVKGQFDVIGNFTYLDTSFQVQQISSPISNLNLTFEKNFKLWVFHSDNKLILQSSSSKLLPLPKVIYLNDFYYQDDLFKNNLRLKLGVSLKYIDGKSLPRYNSIIGLFSLNDTQEKNYPWLDGFVAIKIKSFRAYFMYANFTSLFEKDRHYHFVENYPVFESKYKFGINWQFRN